jgi:DNA topoisomerase IB
MAIHRSDCDAPGLTRRRCGKGFSYRDVDGSTVKDPEVLARVRALVIPPAWQDVWICPDPQGHIQALGTDDKGRRQYRYHPDWSARRNDEKHERILRFAARLPDLRARVKADLAQEGMPKTKVLACAVRLLEQGTFRIGGEVYAEENGSYGLATLRKHHVKVRGDTVEFDYDGKSGQHRQCSVVDADVRNVLVTLRRRRGSADTELLAYRDESGHWVDVRSEDINDYLHDVLGDEFSAKDFRTWVGTVLAAVLLAEEGPAATDTERRRAVTSAVKAVADHLGNTPAVARSAYIDPRVIERFEADDVADDALEADAFRELEEAVVDLIGRARPRRRRARRD